MQAGEKSEDFWSMCAYLFYKTLNLSSRHTQKSNNNKKESGIKNTHGKKRAFWKKSLFWEIYFIGMCMTDFMEPCIKKMFLVFFSLSTWNL